MLLIEGEILRNFISGRMYSSSDAVGELSEKEEFTVNKIEIYKLVIGLSYLLHYTYDRIKPL